MESYGILHLSHLYTTKQEAYTRVFREVFFPFAKCVHDICLQLVVICSGGGYSKGFKRRGDCTIHPVTLLGCEETSSFKAPLTIDLFIVISIFIFPKLAECNSLRLYYIVLI